MIVWHETVFSFISKNFLCKLKQEPYVTYTFAICLIFWELLNLYLLQNIYIFTIYKFIKQKSNISNWITIHLIVIRNRMISSAINKKIRSHEKKKSVIIAWLWTNLITFVIMSICSKFHVHSLSRSWDMEVFETVYFSCLSLLSLFFLSYDSL